MTKHLRTGYFILLLAITVILSAQNETKYWYFGNGAGLNFNTVPPTILSNSGMPIGFSSASVADASGNLLFYTNGTIVYDRTHVPMANGTGLIGVSSTAGSQSTMIIKKPGSSNLYYIFSTQWNFNATSGLYYSEVDMTLAAGNGSVTAKNILLTAGTTTSSPGKLTATRHCNGTDIWLVAREWYYNNTFITGTLTVNNSFRSYLITPLGVSGTPVISTPISYTYTTNTGNYYDYGCMKISPNGKKLGNAIYGYNNFSGQNQNSFELFDYDNTSGIVSNSLALMPTINTANYYNGAWGVEFSPDGTKFYGARWNNVNNFAGVMQWDLCAGSPTAIVASGYTVVPANVGTANFASMQLAADGKIYVSRYSQLALDVINNPNAAGVACGYTLSGQSTSPKFTYYGLPNFMNSYFIQRPAPTPFTYTVSNMYGCQGAQFNSSYNPSITVVGCAASGYSLNSLQWNFGDTASGANNTSNLVTPVHAFTSLGTYSVALVLHYSCGGSTDTLRQVVNINQPCISVSSTSITCAHLGSATVAATGGIGPFSYTWMPTAQTSSVASGLSPGMYTLTVYDFGTSFTYTATKNFTSQIPLTGNLSSSGSITCNGASTGTAIVTNIAGGTGSEQYVWYNTTISLTTPSVSTLSAGVWSLSVTDATTGCQINETFTITQPPAMSLVLSSASPTTCASKSTSLSGVNSGGTPHLTGPAYTYSWVGGAATNTRTVTQLLAGTYIYTLTSKDSLHCQISTTIAIDFIPNPVLSLSSISICPLQAGVLNVSGASTYTWNTAATGSSLSDSPTITRQYTVTATALSCTSQAVASIILKPVPFPFINSNSPICNGLNLSLTGYGGTSYDWSGPLGYSSQLQAPTLTSAAPYNSGVYTLTVTAANSCTASISKTVTIFPTPTISAIGSTVCSNQVLNLSAISFTGAAYLWRGPNNYTSSVQNPSLAAPSVSTSGTYTVKVVSADGCVSSTAADVTVTALPVPTVTSSSPKCLGAVLNLNGSGGDTYLWTGPNGFNSNLQNPVLNNVALVDGGIYNLQIMRGPCVNNKTHSVTIFPLPSFTLSSNSPVCETKTLNLYAGTVSNAASYRWQGPGFNKYAQNTGRDSSRVVFAGVYTVTVKDLNTCENTATVEINVDKNPILATVSTTVCLDQPAVLKVSGAASYLWSGPGFFHSSAANATVLSASDPATVIYTVVGTVGSCSTQVTANVNTYPLPLPSLFVSPTKTLCLNKTFNLQGAGGKNYNWYGPGNSKFTKQSVDITASSMQQAGTYTLVVTDEKGCQDFTTTTIWLDPLPSANMKGSVMDACVPFESEFSYYVTSSPDVLTSWQINGGPVISSKTFSHPFKIAGEYAITGTFIDTVTTCINTATYIVNARPVPVANFTYAPAFPVEGLDDVQFINTSEGSEIKKWSWTLINNHGPVSIQQHTSHFFENAGVYPVALVIKNAWGCSDTVVKNIVIETDFKIYVPNAFTPNSDGNNEAFLPVATGVKFYELFVFDRWGKIIFHTKNLSEGWDGSYNAQLCKPDVYVWKIKASGLNGEMKELDGHVTLLR